MTTTNNPPPNTHTELPGYDVDSNETPGQSVANPVAAAASVPLPTSPGSIDPPALAATASFTAPEGPPPVAQEQGTPALPERPGESPTPRSNNPPTDEDLYASNEQLAALHAIFPDFDAQLLLSVLESVGGDQDRAVDTLLGMSDPEHVSTSIPERPQEPISQTDLDEQFARQLMLQEQEEYARQHDTRNTRSGSSRWEPQSGREHPIDGGPQSDEPQRDTFADVQDQLGKFAETGRRTFTSFVSKVKQKVQELDQSRTQQREPSQIGQDAGISGAGWGAPQPGLDRHQQAAYYAPTAIQPSVPTLPPSTQAEARTVPGHDYAQDPAPTTTPPPPRTNSGPPIDPSRVGLLPKNPVSLLGANAGSGTGGQTHGHPPPDDDEELEYVENPFEEGRR